MGGGGCLNLSLVMVCNNHTKKKHFFSFSVNFNSKIFMDTIFTKTGVKLKADVFTTASFHQNITIRNGNFFVLNFSLPLKKIEIFSAK